MKIFLMLHQNFLQIDYIATNKIDKLIFDFMLGRDCVEAHFVIKHYHG